METDLILSAINNIHQQINHSFESKNAEGMTIFMDASFRFTGADGKELNLKDYRIELESVFRRSKTIETSHYRIKSSYEENILTEKIARKSVLIKPRLVLFSKKQTIQTEEIFKWSQVKGEWKIISIEIGLEEKY